MAETYSRQCQEGRLVPRDVARLSEDVREAIERSSAAGVSVALDWTFGREVELYAECYGYSERAIVGARMGELLQQYVGPVYGEDGEETGREWRVSLRSRIRGEG